jgi:ATP-dependent Zn protease
MGYGRAGFSFLFATARCNAPSVIFFDEFDSVASQRSTYSDGGSRANNAVVAQLLTELDGLLSAQLLAERICAHFGCSYEPPLSIVEEVA